MKKKKRVDKLIKRVFDILLSAGGLVIFFPAWMVIAIFVKTTSYGPIFFIQERPGYKRRFFKVYKFRTMFLGSEQMIKGKEVMGNDARVTSFGKILRRTKLDEIPQLLNILKGDMSLIGPRPERIDSLKDYTKEIEKRLTMKPGLTGLAQVSGNIYLDLNERYKLDVYYVEHFSLLLDLKILLRTIGVVFLGENHYKGKSLI